MTSTEITNLACIRIGANTIQNLEDEPLHRPSYKQAVSEILRAHNWNFAIVRKELPKQSGTAPFSSSLPKDFIRRVELLTASDGRQLRPTEYRIEGGFIISDFETLHLRYISSSTPTATYPPDFTEALITLLASKLVATILKQASAVDALYQDYLTFKLPEAKRNDALDSPGSLYPEHTTPAAASPAIRSRYDNEHPRYRGFTR